MQRTIARLLLIAGLLSIPLASFAGDKRRAERNRDRYHDRDDYRYYDRDEYRYYRSELPPGLEKRRDLPPGLDKQVRRRGELPPGLEKRRDSDFDGRRNNRGRRR